MRIANRRPDPSSSSHIPLSEVGRVLGHTQANTTYRYVNANIETARRASAALDEFNAEDEGTADVRIGELKGLQ